MHFIIIQISTSREWAVKMVGELVLLYTRTFVNGTVTQKRSKPVSYANIYQ